MTNFQITMKNLETGKVRKIQHEAAADGVALADMVDYAERFYAIRAWAVAGVELLTQDEADAIEAGLEAADAAAGLRVS